MPPPLDTGGAGSVGFNFTQQITDHDHYVTAPVELTYYEFICPAGLPQEARSYRFSAAESYVKKLHTNRCSQTHAIRIFALLEIARNDANGFQRNSRMGHTHHIAAEGQNQDNRAWEPTFSLCAELPALATAGKLGRQ